jgi:two-component system OmpR family sensor kinase
MTMTTEVAPRRFGTGLTRARLRILGWFVLLVAGAVVAGLLIQRQALLARLERDLDATMRQELDELEALAGGVDPGTGRPFTSVQALFDLALDRNVPLDGEAVATFVAGAPAEATAGGELLFEDEPFVRATAAVQESTEGRVGTSRGEARYIARPVRIEGATTTVGVFVAAVFTEGEREEVEAGIRASALAALAALLGAGATAWIVAGRVLAPVREVTDAARLIGESDLSRRIPVEGDDEIAELATTFNEMLDRLEGAFAAQRAFLDDAGHELRTPITIVQGHLDLLGDDPDDRAETLALVQDELDRMGRIVSDLLVLARAEQPDFLRLGPVDLAVLVGEVHARAVALDERPWSVVVPPTPVVVTADRERLLQAVLNLVTNAVAHTPPGTAVEIGAGRDAAGRPVAWVADAGPGIAPADQARVFDRFTRLQPGRAGRASSGSGLGLAIVAAIVEAHGGSVAVDPTTPSGTLILITLGEDRTP